VPTVQSTLLYIIGSTTIGSSSGVVTVKAHAPVAIMAGGITVTRDSALGKTAQRHPSRTSILFHDSFTEPAAFPQDTSAATDL
jgi:hypothetical protein